MLPRIADAKPGLHEVKDMNEMVTKLQDIDEDLKVWFRSEMGMSKSCPLSRLLYTHRLCLNSGPCVRV